MFTIFENVYKGDLTDFYTADGKKVDMKTASKSYHTCILVPKDQYYSQKKDYYVGVRIFESKGTSDIILLMLF